MDPTIIRFIPGFEICSGLTAPAHNRYNYHVIVRRRSNDAISLSGKTLRLGDRISARELVNFFFNKPAGDASFAPADFSFVRDWFRQPTVGNGPFRIEAI